MKLLLTMNLPYTRVYGGANRSNRSLAEAFAAKGHHLRVVVPALAALSPITHEKLLEDLAAEGVGVSNNAGIDRFKLNGVDVHAVIDPSRLYSYLAEQIHDFQPDWTFVSSEDRSQSLLETALKAHQSRVIYLAHTPQMFPFGPASLYPGKRRTELVGQTAGIVTISRFVADYIRKWTDFESFIHHPPHYGSAPFPNLGSIENDYVLMMNACAVKGISTFLALARALPDIRFAALAGWGTTTAEREVLSTLPNVVLMDNGKNLDDILRQTRALLMPSLWVEGFGMAVVDAMLRGIPTLAANHGGLIEAKLGTDYLLPVRPLERFEDRLDENMLPVPIVPEQDILPWQNALSRLVSDRGLYQRQSAAARDAALRFVGGLSVEPLEDLLLRLVTEKKASRYSYRGKPEDHLSEVTVSNTARTVEGIADLTPEQQALLMLRLRKKASSRAKREPSLPTIQPVSRDQELPLSFAQQRLWFLDEYEPNSSLYNIPSALRLRGPLNVAALEQSLSEMIRRHESLRTTFSTVEGEPVQVISPAVNSPLSVMDLSNAAESAREEEAQRLAREEARRPFDLGRGPLFRSKLLRLEDQEHILLLTMHHIVSDGWSMGILYRELSVLYGAFSVGKVSPLPDLAIQYADFAVWQRQWLQGEILESQLSYWKKQLQGIPEVLNLPTDYPRPVVQGSRGACESIELSKDLSDGLKALSREEGVTLFMTLLAGFQTILHRHSGQDDIVVGSPIANRNRREIEGLIGFFLNTLVFRAQFSQNPTFKELLARVREAALGAFAHQDLPFEKLVEELKPERSLSHGPLFQVLFNMANQKNSKLEFLGLTTHGFSSWELQSKFDLTLYVTEEKDQIRFNLVYQADLFSQARMACLLEQYKYVLKQIVASPQDPIRSYSLVTPESRPLLSDPSAVLAEPPQELITGLFISRASRTPEQPAISHGKNTWSYEELARQAETVGRVLRAHGLKRGEVVAVYGRRSFGLVCSAMGVLLSGGVLLPVDPDLPDQRKQLMLRQSGATILLNISKGEAQDPWVERQADLTILFVNADNGRCVVDKSFDLTMMVLPKLAPDDPAYIFFTSGTSGVPKGVLGCHKGLSHFLHWQRETFAIGPEDRIAQLTNLSFDPVLRDVFLPLSSGALLCLPEGGDSLSPDEILRWLESERISVLHTVPSLTQSWLAGSRTKVCLKRMRWVFFAGEPLTANVVHRWRATFPESNGEIVNLYGPTETTLAKCFYRVPADIPGGVQPVGCPLPETQALVLREDHQPCGIGEPGEIVLRTPYRTLGYINAPEEHRQRFVKNPLRDDDKDLLYYTGDRGRYRPDGTLEILGRLDDQVKIRGVRVEPDEITVVLSQHPEVKASFVLARRDDQDQNYLVAYVVPSEKDRITVQQLRTYLSGQLPSAMIPTIFVFMEQLPLTPNGKVDRKALPAPDLSSTELDSGYVAPRTPVEELIANIWATVLKLDKAGVHDNFFDLGGHSLLATQVLSRLREVFQVELPLRSLFETPTVAGLTESIEEARRKDRDIQNLEIISVSRDKDLPLSFSQQRLWFLDQLEPNSSLYNVSNALRLSGVLNVQALNKSIDAIVARHEALRTTFHSVDGEPKQIIDNSPCVELARIDLRKLREGDRDLEIQSLVREEAQRPFNLSSDLMLRSTLLQLDEQEHVLLLVMHHIASDGWSMGVLFRELAVLYAAFCKGESSPLADLAIQYPDFAIWQRRHLQGKTLDNQLSYWKNQLAGAPFLLNLATDRPRQAMLSHRGTSHSFILPKGLSDELKTLSLRESVTLYMTLLAAFNVLLYRYTRQTDLVIGSPIAGRNRPEIEDLIGFFVNTLVLRTDLSGEISFKELLGRVRKVVLDAFSHQDLPFEKLVELLRPKRDASYRALVQIAFAFQNAPRLPLQLGDLSISPVRIESESAKLDLTLFLWETENGLAGALNYNTDLFDSDTISRMAEHFQKLLEGIVSNPEYTLERFPPFPHEVRATPLTKACQAMLDPYESSNLTRNQLLIWAGQKLHSGLPLYNVPYTFILNGQVDPAHLQRAIQIVLNSSDALRTFFREIDGVPQQSVVDAFPCQLEYLDFSKDPCATSAYKRWVETRSQRCFDFGGPLFDFALLKLADHRYVWYLNLHHIISDGWSVGLIFRWVGELYGRSLQMSIENRVEIPAYSSYVDYERQYRRSERFTRVETYWKKKLAERLPTPTFYGRSSQKGTSESHRVSCDLGIDRTTRLKQLADEGDFRAVSERAALFHAFAAFLFVYLYRVSGVRRHSIGTPFHNRRSKDFKETLGLLMEVLPLRLTIEEDETFRSLIRKVQLEASQVFRMCHNIANSPQNKAYDVLLNYYTASYRTFCDMPVRVERLPTSQDNHSLALQIHDFDVSGSLAIDFDFNSGVFDASQSRFAVDHFLQILDAYLTDPNQPIRHVELLTQDEKHQLLVEFNRSEIGSETNICIHQLFERRVEQTPNAVALVSPGPDLAAAQRQQLTYKQLNARANQLAHHLIKQGVSRGCVVGVCLERSADAVIAILGVLKAGGVYLPLNPDYPADRLVFMLEDARPMILLTHKRSAATLPLDRIRLVYLDTDSGAWELESAGNPVLQQTPDDPVYIVYTSGSIGRSKGVVVLHRSLVNAYRGWEESYHLTSGHTHLQMANLSFDVFSGDLVRALCSGGKLVICPTEIMLEPALLLQLMRQERVAWAEFVPPVLRQLVAYMATGNHRLDFMQGIVCGSDIWSVDDYRQCQRFCGPKTRLINSYGVTEATIDSSFFEGSIPSDTTSDSVPIGRRFSGTQFYILDELMRPTLTGVPGELYIGGQGLSEGYLNQPELTAQKFIPHPFSDEPGARLYRTGDLARYLKDGNVEFLGRVDLQLKIRGFRIEPGEIESTLRGHPGIQQALVLAREDAATGDKILVAYVVRSQPNGCTAAELHDLAKIKLPAYMVPRALIFMESLPLNANGKVDFQALPAPEGDRPELTESFVAPRTRAEEKLAEIWAKLLGVNQVGIRDNFFDLGGHSLLAVRLFAEIEKAFGKRPPLASLFQEPTIGHLAKLISHEHQSETSSSLVTFQAHGSRVPFFCVHTFFGDVLCYMNLARHMGPEQPFYAIEARGFNGTDEPFDDIKMMAAYYIEQIRSVRPRGPYALGGFCSAGIVAFEMAQQLRAKGEQVAMVALLDTRAYPSRNEALRQKESFLRDFIRDIPSWLMGAFELNRSQWVDLVKLKIRTAKANNAVSNRTEDNSQDQRGTLIQEWLGFYGFTEHHRKVARAQSRALKDYKFQVYPGRLSLFKARMQPLFSSHNPDKGWERLAAGGVEVRTVPGNQLGMLKEPHVQVLAEQLRLCLDRSSTEHARKVELQSC